MDNNIWDMASRYDDALHVQSAALFNKHFENDKRDMVREFIRDVVGQFENIKTEKVITLCWDIVRTHEKEASPFKKMAIYFESIMDIIDG